MQPFNNNGRGRIAQSVKRSLRMQKVPVRFPGQAELFGNKDRANLMYTSLASVTKQYKLVLAERLGKLTGAFTWAPAPSRLNLAGNAGIRLKGLVGISAQATF